MVNICVPGVNPLDVKDVSKAVSDVQDFNYAIGAQMIETWNRGMATLDPFEENEHLGSLSMGNELPEIRLPKIFIQAMRPVHDHFERFLR